MMIITIKPTNAPSDFFSSVSIFRICNPTCLNYIKKATKSKATIFKIFIIGLIAGPAVSL
jgi:hypothetical protein